MREKIYVEFLTFLDVIVKTTGKEKLMLIEVSGVSNLEKLGVPKLMPKIKEMENSTDGILEFDFVIIPSDEIKWKRLEWDLSVVFDMEKLPKEITGIKVKANRNADLVLLSMANN